MLVGFNEILSLTDGKNFAIPAFNVYNMETVMGVIKAAEEEKAPIIMQCYSRLATTGNMDYLAPIILKSAQKASIPVCFHLDHGAGIVPASIAVKNGCTGIMVDYSTLNLEDNITSTKKVVDVCNELGIGVEGELGQIGKAVDGVPTDYTTVKDAKNFVENTGVTALAVAVGTAHGRYKQAPILAIDRIKEIDDNVNAYLVLHGGSGVPDDQIKQAINAGIRKINFGTDLCYSFLDKVFETDRSKIAIDLFMNDAIQSVCDFAKSKIKLLNANGKF